DPEYADYFSSPEEGIYYEGSHIRPSYIRMNKPFDARKYRLVTGAKFCEIIGVKDDDKYAPYDLERKLPFWRWVLLHPQVTKAALERQGYDGIIQWEAKTVGVKQDKTAYIVFNPSQIRSVFEKPKGKKSAAKPGIMYHVSRRTNRGKIRAEGLRPLIKEFKEVEREPGVFLFATWAIALEWAWYHAQYVNQPIDVWEVVLPEGYKLSPDTHKDMKDFNAWVGREPIPAGNLKLERTTLIPKPGDQPPAPWDKRMAADRMIDVGEGDQYWAGEGNAASGVLP